MIATINYSIVIQKETLLAKSKEAVSLFADVCFVNNLTILEDETFIGYLTNSAKMLGEINDLLEEKMKMVMESGGRYKDYAILIASPDGIHPMKFLAPRWLFLVGGIIWTKDETFKREDILKSIIGDID